MNKLKCSALAAASVLLLFTAACSSVDSDKQADANRKLLLSLRAPHPKRMIAALDLGADPNTCDKDGVPVLTRAIAAENMEQVKLLLRAGANVNAQDKDGETPLHAAASLKTLDYAKLLIENGANVNAAGKSGRTPAMEATRLGNIEMLRFLADSGANLYAVDERGASLASFAAVAPENVIEIFNYLKDKDIASHIDQPDIYTSPLLISQFCRNDQAALYLLKIMPDFDKDPSLDPVGQISIRLAIQYEQQEIFEALIAKKLELNRTLPFAFRAARIINIEGVYKFLARNSVLDRGYTPLMFACICARADMVTKLVEAGADPYTLSNEGENSFSYANDQATYDALTRAAKGLKQEELSRKIGSGLQLEKDAKVQKRMF